MHPMHRSVLSARAFACWNWKCALMSATPRSVVYLAALARPAAGMRMSRSLSIVLVEIAYVTITAGLYAGLQQKALALRCRVLGNLTVVLGVPVLSQFFDWLTHHIAGAPAPARATLAVCIYAVVSACFHLHVMRRGAFLTGGQSHSLAEDFRRLPQLVASFVARPLALVPSLAGRVSRNIESQAIL